MLCLGLHSKWLASRYSDSSPGFFFDDVCQLQILFHDISSMVETEEIVV